MKTKFVNGLIALLPEVSLGLKFHEFESDIENKFLNYDLGENESNFRFKSGCV